MFTRATPGSHIPGIYLVYKSCGGIYLVYTCYIPYLNFLRFPDAMLRDWVLLRLCEAMLAAAVGPATGGWRTGGCAHQPVTSDSEGAAARRPGIASDSESRSLCTVSYYVPLQLWYVNGMAFSPIYRAGPALSARNLAHTQSPSLTGGLGSA